MSELTSKFSLYEALRILIPGLFLTTNFGVAKKLLGIEYFLDSYDNEYRIVFIFLAVFVSGIVVYALDLPKRINFFQKDLPSAKILIKHKNFKKITVLNSYFSFYDFLPSDQKKKTEVYSGLYHFLINISFCALLSSGVFCLKYEILKELIFLNLFCGITCLLTACLIYFSRLKASFQRHLESYYNSESYKQLVRSNLTPGAI